MPASARATVAFGKSEPANRQKFVSTAAQEVYPGRREVVLMQYIVKVAMNAK